MSLYGRIKEQLKWSNLREKQLVANTIEQFDNLSSEQRMVLGIAFAVGGFLLLVMIFFRGYGAVGDLKSQVDIQQKELAKVTEFSQGFQGHQRDVQRIRSEIRRRPKTFSLKKFVTDQISRAGIPNESVTSLKEQMLPPKGELQESNVNLRLSKIGLKGLSNFIYGIERSQNVTRVKELHIKLRSDDNRYLDSNITISTVVEAPK